MLNTAAVPRSLRTLDRVGQAHTSARPFTALLSAQRLRQLLGVLWLIDGLLQLQPQMFTSTFISSVMAPIATGQPGIIGTNLRWVVGLASSNLVLLNLFIAAVQVTLGVLLISGRWWRQALIVSIAWALGVWYAGEGMNGLLTGQASVLTGAPGAVLFYALLALALLPGSQLNPLKGGQAFLSRLELRKVLGGFWLFGAALQLQPTWWAGQQVSQTIGGAAGLGGLDGRFLDPGIIRGRRRHLRNGTTSQPGTCSALRRAWVLAAV